jgi:predicted Zn-dependent protease
MLVIAGCATNPITGESQLMLFSEEQDIELGKNYAPEIEKEMGGRIQNLMLQNYVNSVGQNVARVSHKPYFEYEFVALDDDTLNAFALPGGYIFVTKGMLQKLENEAQLAAILSHETVHVVARHSSAMISREIGVDIALSVASKKASGSVLQAAGIARQMIGLKYSRSQEREADLGGIDYMVKAGYDPWQMVATMQMLEAQNEVRPIEFFSTHPSPQSRVSYISEAIYARGYSGAGMKVGAEDYKRNVLDELNY